MESIGDFAENLISEELQSVHSGKALPPSMSSNQHNLAPAGKDIQGIQVPDEFMQQVLGEAYTPRKKATPISESSDEPINENTSLLTEDTANELISLLSDVKGLLSEMMTAAATTSGQIGTNFAGPSGKKSDSWGAIEKRYGYISATKSPIKATNAIKSTSRKEVLKNSIKRRLKK